MEQIGAIRTRPKHGMFIRLVKGWNDGDDSRALRTMVLEQRGFEDYDITIRFGEKGAARDEIKRKAGRIVIPVGGRDFKRVPLDPVEDAELLARGKTHRSTYDVSIQVSLPSDLRGPKNLDNRLLWLLDRERYMLASLNTIHNVHDQVAVRAMREQFTGAAAHLRAMYDKWSRYNGAPIAMADYSASGQRTWNQTTGDNSGSSTWPSGASVAFGYAAYTSGTLGSTVDSVAQDDAFQVNDDVDNERSVITIHGDPTTGSSVTSATTGVGGSGDNIGACYALTDTDVSEIETTGFPATASSLADSPVSVNVTTAVDDMAICAWIAFTFASDPPTYTPNTGDTAVQAAISGDGEMGYVAYEKATTTTTTMGVTFGDSEGFNAFSLGVVPTAEAGAGSFLGHLTPRTRRRIPIAV